MGSWTERTGVYWGVDAFACPMPDAPFPTVSDFDAEFWAGGMAMFVHNALSPWLGLVDHARYAELCDRVQALGMRTIATAHSPLITEAAVDDAFRILRELPAVPAPPVPDQLVLEMLLTPAMV